VENSTIHKKVIGLTGTYCAGKNYVGRILEERGLPVLDVDKLGHQAIETERERLLAHFGTGILGVGGVIDRRRLGERVFGNPAELAILEGIVHPAVNRMTDEWIAEQGAGTCIINAAVLHKSSAFAGLTGIILVQAPVLTRLLRALRRDKLPLGQLLRRFRTQQEFTLHYLTNNADICMIKNRGCFCASRRRIENRVDEILSKIGIIK
jgi:dephospho-CoA kinase